MPLPYLDSGESQARLSERFPRITARARIRRAVTPTAQPEPAPGEVQMTRTVGPSLVARDARNWTRGLRRTHHPSRELAEFCSEVCSAHGWRGPHVVHKRLNKEYADLCDTYFIQVLMHYRQDAVRSSQGRAASPVGPIVVERVGVEQRYALLAVSRLGAFAAIDVVYPRVRDDRGAVLHEPTLRGYATTRRRKRILIFRIARYGLWPTVMNRFWCFTEQVVIASKRM